MNSGAKNMATVMFFKTAWHAGAPGHLDYFKEAVWGQLMVLLSIFLMFES